MELTKVQKVEAYTTDGKLMQEVIYEASAS